MVFGKFFGKKNYAKDFKTAFEKDDVNKMVSILGKWNQKGKDDANYYLAIVLTEIKLEEPLNEIQGRYIFAKSYKPDDVELYSWFESTASRLIVDMSTIDNINNNDSQDDFAKEFVKRLRKIEVISDMNKLQRIHLEMWEILNSWEEKSPDDANFICAYIIMNLPKLNENRFEELYFKAKTGIPIDKSSHKELLDNVETFAKIKQYEVNKYDKFKGLSCEEFPVIFLGLKDQISKVTDGNFGTIIADINYLLSDWERKCPNDANYSCAYLMANIDTFNNDEKRQMIEKILSQKPINEQAYDVLIEDVKAIIKYTNN